MSKIEKDRPVIVENRTDSVAVIINPPYPRRTLQKSGQKMEVTYGELENLMNTSGGETMLREYFIIRDEEVLLELFQNKPQPEYFYTTKTIKYLLENGTLDQLEDTINFAPRGVVDLIIKMAVDLMISDANKRELITNLTGYQIDTQIKNKKMLAEEDVAPKKQTGRKAKPLNEDGSEQDIEEEAPKKRGRKAKTIEDPDLLKSEEE